MSDKSLNGILTTFDVEITALERRLDKLRAARESVSDLLLERRARPSRSRADGRKGGRRRIADGSLEHRILELAKEPTTLKAIVDGAGARKGDVRKAVTQLQGAKRLSRTGWSKGARYQAR